MDNSQPPLVSGPEPSFVAKLVEGVRNIRAAIDAQRARLPAARPEKAERPKRQKPAKTGDAPAHVTDYGAKPWEKITAFLLIAPFTAIMYFPIAADFLGDPREAIARLVAAYPILAPGELYLRAALWQAPMVATATFALRLFALTKTFKNGLNAGGVFVLALLIDGASWFIWGRENLPVSGLSSQEQIAAGHLMIVFAVYSLTVWSLFGPPPAKRTGTTGFDQWR